MLTTKQIVTIRKAFNGTGQRALFKILGDKNRYRIFEMLSNYPQLTVSEMATVLNVSLPLTSQHLKILEQAHILEKEKQGQKVFYKLRGDNRIAQAIIKDIL